jgi:hypothetical protein
MRRENDSRVFTEYLFIVMNQSETEILDGGFEARKGRIWKGLDAVLERYRRFLIRNYQLILDIERNARRGNVETPEVHIQYVLGRITYYEGLVLYQLDPQYIESGLIRCNGTFCFVRVGNLRDIAQEYGYYMTFDEYKNKIESDRKRKQQKRRQKQNLKTQ